MIDKKYFIKIISPWMIDELLVYSEKSQFEVILLQQQEEFNIKEIKKLQSKNISVLVNPFKYNFLFKKTIFIIRYFIKNLTKFSFDYNAVIGFKSLILFFRIDLSLFSENSNIHAQFGTQASILANMIKEYFNNKPAYSFTFHAYDIYFKNRWFNKLTENSIRAFTISEYNIKYVEDKYMASNKYSLSRLGVFRDTIKPIEKEASPIFIFGFMSWFVEKKGIDYLLKAFNELKESGIDNVRLVLAGDGPLKDDIVSFIESKHLQKSVDYIGSVGRNEKDEFYNSLDGFILPSVKLEKDQDGIPVVLMEAIAYGLPIISTDVSGIPEICINDFNGILINERNVNEIVNAIKLLVNNPSKVTEYGKNSLLLSNDYDIIDNSIKKGKKIGWIN